MREERFLSPARRHVIFRNVVKKRKRRNVLGQDISSSDLGNLNYALVGKALGIPESLLLQQAGAAQLRKDFKMGIPESEIESLKRSNHGYGDQQDDQDMITYGFNLYNLFD